MSKVDACVIPDELNSRDLSNLCVIVIDVLRATTTIIEALHHGARAVHPTPSIESAQALAKMVPSSVLCGERNGVKPDGFQFGNSPLEYTSTHIQGMSCILTTTNGTKALSMSVTAEDVLIASFTNISAVAEYIQKQSRDVLLVCSGTDGRVSLEDCLCAGALVDLIQRPVTDAASLLYHAYQHALAEFQHVRYAIESSFHAKRLIQLGFDDDVKFASQVNTRIIVPRYSVDAGVITVD